MGLDKASAEILCAAKSLGADFQDSAMIGRQWLSTPLPTLRDIAALHAPSFEVKASKYAEPLFKMLGANSVDSFDISEFEQATIMHDMNKPVPEELFDRFSLVFDGGTLEHIFNAPQAFSNCMKMLRVGGFFVQNSPGNNFMGHGFWQFSPELLYRMFSEENGFRTRAVIVQELPHLWRETRYGKFYVARDPMALGWRVELRNIWPTNVAIIAEKIADVEPFNEWPQQSDYVQLWDNDGAKPSKNNRSLKSVLGTAVPPGLERLLRNPLKNKAYLPLKATDLMRGILPSN